MKKLAIIVFVCLLFSLGRNSNAYASTKEMKAAWITTVYNSDWPSQKGNSEAQKQQMRNILDNLKDAGINTVMFQVRPKGDALYNSTINPWSDVLTGKQGVSPGYDPLAFVIEEAHKRDMEVHAWLNPYRVTTSGTDLSILSENNPARQHPDWTLVHNGRIYFNPELPQVKQLIYDTVGEIVRNYDVDGIHFDDYFYPENYPLPAGEGRDGKVANARRNNINEMIFGVKNTIKSIKPQVKFGVSPSGIWKNKSSDQNGSDTRGKESYYSDYADTIGWIKNNYVDYVVPQLYWQIGYSIADYSKLVSWWSNQVNGSNVDLYIGQGIYKDEVASEIDKQLNLNNQYYQIKGSFFYSTSDIISNRAGCRDKMKSILATSKFKDINGHWAQVDIEKFIKYGYINGYEDNTFRPEGQITRAEFVKLVNRVFNLTEQGNINFTDVSSSDWYYNEVRVAAKYGYINGYEDKSFRPNNPITRQEAMKIITTLKNNKDENIDKIYNYNDFKQIEDWAKSYVEGAIEAGYIKGDEKGNINPQGKLTRAESITMLDRLIQN
ncbi:family 10 glycosylhydrolase [Paraclostridium ghonii]|uniref:family 10 glycosylhydrolase n=1 Tax=Paraclostridium ghonii TaxID=29358 RepID=UPI00202CE370|nr:family 10 glycosylhydrolase [Paeniclostridium ghonii]MCM0167420.1 family 10 glycosylhydrolase [Paeniclostridium ghonii]